MSFTDLLPILREHSRADKLRVLQLLVLDLAKEEEALLAPEVSYPIWSPYKAFDAADVLLNVLERDKRQLLYGV